MKKKINIGFVIISILAIVTTVIGVTFIYYGLFQQQIRSDLEISAKLLKDTHFFESVNTDTDRIDLSADMTELRVTWIDRDGTVLYDNDATAKSLTNHLNRPEIQMALKNGEGELVRLSDTMNQNTYYYALVLDNGTVLRVATNARSLWSVFMSVAPVIILIVLVLITVCVFISHFLTLQFLKPIEMMAENIENSDYKSPYRELEPFSQMLRAQHTDILSAAIARQEFTANVSHELKTPLTAISGYAELLENDMADEKRKKHFYCEIRKNADRLLALINDIIKLSALDRKDHEPVFSEMNLYETVSECMETLSVNARRAGVTLSFEGEPCTVCGNRDMIRELTENLVQNAIRYNNPGGKVFVSVIKNEEAMLIVRDNGIGIPASEQQRVFERFYRVDKSRSKATGGTGLGLAIVKHIVDLHEAKIELDSAPGVGTTVSVRFCR